MAESLKAYFYSGNSDNSVYGVNWDAQTFPVINSYLCTKVVLKLYRYGLPGTIYAAIRATAAGVPTGGDLVVKSIDGNTITTSSSGLTYEFLFDAAYPLPPGQYAIVLRAPSGSGTKVIYWKRTTSGVQYPDGYAYFSSNSGGSWTIQTNTSQWFEVWGLDKGIMDSQAARMLQAGAM